MDFKQLEAFLQVVRTRSFSKAGEAMGLSQPTVSNYMKDLEEWAGTQLLIRSTKEVVPSPSGEELFRYAQNILALRDQALAKVSHKQQDLEGRIEILSSSVPAQYLLPKAIAGFRRTYPSVSFHISQRSSQVILDTLTHEPYDLGVVGTKPLTQKYRSIPFVTDQLVLVWNPAYVTPEADWNTFLTTTPFLFRETGSGTLRELERYLQDRKLTLGDLQPVVWLADTQSILQGVVEGAGISAVSIHSAIELEKQGVLCTKLLQVKRPRQFHFLLPKDRLVPPVVEAFVQYTTELY